jgi:O-antigen/teichoic acid export membrane protein
MGAFGATFTPMISALYANKEMKQLDELFKVSTKWGLYCILPLFLAICFASREVMTVVFDPRYASGSPLLAILAAGQLVNVGTGAVGILLVMTGHQNRWLMTSAAMLCMNVVLTLLLVPRLGLVGGALSAALALGGLYILGLIHVKRSLGLWPYDRRYWKGLVATVSVIAALYLLNSLDITSATLDVSLTLMTSCGVFAAVLLLQGLDDEDSRFLRLVQRRLSP